MDRCPNCGAQVRPDARFCTTCGYRLSDTVAAKAIQPAQQVDDSVAVVDSTQTVSATQEAAAPGTEELAEEVVAAAPATEQPVTADEQAPAESWPSSWNTWPSNQETAESTDDTEASEMANGNQPSEQLAADTVSETAEDTTATAAGDNEEQSIPIGTIEPAPEAEASPEVADISVGVGGAATSAAANGSTLDHALALVDQLRELLPELVTAPASGAEDTTIADDLAAARDSAGSGQADDFAKLRETVSAARAQPRDIDTMLQLVGSLDTIAVLQDHYDHLGQAVDQAIARLRGEQDGTSETSDTSEQ